MIEQNDLLSLAKQELEAQTSLTEDLSDKIEKQRLGTQKLLEFNEKAKAIFNDFLAEKEARLQSESELSEAKQLIAELQGHNSKLKEKLKIAVDDIDLYRSLSKNLPPDAMKTRKWKE